MNTIPRKERQNRIRQKNTELETTISRHSRKKHSITGIQKITRTNQINPIKQELFTHQGPIRARLSIQATSTLFNGKTMDQPSMMMA